MTSSGQTNRQTPDTQADTDREPDGQNEMDM